MREAEKGKCPRRRCRGTMARKEHDFYKCQECGGEFWPLAQRERQREFGDAKRPAARCPGPGCGGTLCWEANGEPRLVCLNCGGQFWPGETLEAPITRRQVLEVMREEARRGSGKGGTDPTGRAKKKKKTRAQEGPWTLA